MHLLRLCCAFGPLRRLIARRFAVRDAALAKSVFGLSFSNPVGLGAGFDKNAKYLAVLEALGFGFVEIGTVTPRPQRGNPKPRLFRLPADGALINRMGFNNHGMQAVVKRLKKWKTRQAAREKRSGLPRLLIGGNIGKNKDTPNENAWRDYDRCFEALHPYVDFFVVNVSSPNTPGLRALQEKKTLRTLLEHLQHMNEVFMPPKPILLKIAPDLTAEQIDDVIDLATEIGLDGLVVANTTISRDGLESPASRVQKIGAGGLSGLPLQQRATELVAYIHQKAPGLPLIASGGIFTGADAKDKLDAGGSLVEVWTGFIYEGPEIVKRICKALP